MNSYITSTNNDDDAFSYYSIFDKEDTMNTEDVNGKPEEWFYFTSSFHHSVCSSKAGQDTPSLLSASHSRCTAPSIPRRPSLHPRRVRECNEREVALYHARPHYSTRADRDAAQISLSFGEDGKQEVYIQPWSYSHKSNNQHSLSLRFAFSLHLKSCHVLVICHDSWREFCKAIPVTEGHLIVEKRKMEWNEFVRLLYFLPWLSLWLPLLNGWCGAVGEEDYSLWGGYY